MVRSRLVGVGSQASFVALALAASLAACGGEGGPAVIDPGDGGNYNPQIDPANFVDRIDNPFLPFLPGAAWTYQSPDGSVRIDVEVLQETRDIMGITATVVRDRQSEDGQLTEETLDWYAQDADGNVWYMGEDSKEYDDGQVVGTPGSWEAGVDGALPGIIMLADPTVGRAYRQEYYKGEAEDMAEVLRLDGNVNVPFGSFANLLVTEEWTPLERKVVENKYYAKDIGLVLEETVKGGNERAELVSFTPGR